MTEKLLQYIWQFQYYNRNDLQTESGELLQIIFPGKFNFNQGPDFSDAKIIINKTIWAGNIELHINTSDWQKHNHSDDRNYNNVILHVVWENDINESENNIPLLILHDRVSKLLLIRYEEWMNNQSFVPCEKNISQVNEITWMAWKQRLLIERLQRKTKLVEDHLQQNNNHWEETFWWMLARNFGFTINADAFEAMAKSVSINILAKHKNQIHQLEALLLGQCGLLENNFTESYPLMLQKEYSFLKKKYSFQNIHQPVHFLRMRPGNFPTIRLAQLAMLVQQSTHLFSVIKEIDDVKMIKKLFSVEANDYWHYHYVFDELSSYKKKILGKQMIDNIIINTIVPVIFAYGKLHNQNIYKEKALQWLEELEPEKNAITNGWKNIGAENKNAFHSQSLIELKTQFCDKRKCLECAIGNALLKFKYEL